MPVHRPARLAARNEGETPSLRGTSLRAGNRCAAARCGSRGRRGRACPVPCRIRRSVQHGTGQARPVRRRELTPPRPREALWSEGRAHSLQRASLRGGGLDLVQRKRPDARFCASGLEVKPDNDLLSHGETPHYHRRRAVSLLSSGWDQVVPTRYDRQANRDRPALVRRTARKLMKRNCAPGCTGENATNRGPNSFGLGYMVKPHGQLVRVSSTPHNAYTSRLSTS